MQKAIVLPHQSKYMLAPYLYPELRYFFMVCGYGSGKTRANAIALTYAIKILQNKKDRAGDYARLIVAGYTLSHLNKTILPYLRQYLAQSRTPYTENKKDNYFDIGTVRVLVIPIENPENIFGYDSWAVYVEELDELTEDKALEAVRALSERCRQQVIGLREPFLCFGSTSQGQKGLYRIYHHFKKTGVGFLLIRGRTQDNPFLPASQIEFMLKSYTPEEKRVFMGGEFLAIAKGRVLGDFDWERNYLDYDLDTRLLPGETVYIGMDFNLSFNRASAYVVRDGVIYGIKYYDFPDPQDAPSVFRHDFPAQRILWIPDVTIKDSFPQFARELRKYGIQIIYRKKSPLVEDTVFLVNKLFYTGRLMMCRIAKDLAEACALAMRDKDNKIPKGIGPGCLLSTTRIITKLGWKQIKNISVNDYVLTRQGWRRVVWSGVTGIKEVGIFDKRFICTSDHPIKHGKAQKEAGLITGLDGYDTVSKKEARRWIRLGTLVSLMEDMEKRLRLLFGTIGYSTGLLTQRRMNLVPIIFQLLAREEMVKAKGYTLRYGSIIMALCLLGLLSITRISTLTIMILKICSVFLTRIMSSCTPVDGIKNIPVQLKKFLTRLGRRHPCGAKRRTEEKSSKKPENVFGRLSRSALLRALPAEESLRRELSRALSSTVAITVERPRCGGKGKVYRFLTRRAEVWDISVEGVHEFCAEGVFVANSPMHAIDGLRYAITFIAMRDKAFKGIRRLILDKRASFRPDSGAKIQNLGNGYMLIDPEALRSRKI